MLFEISKDLGKSSVTHVLLAEVLTTKNQNILTNKTKIRENRSSRNQIHVKC